MTAIASLARTPLHDWHAAHGGKLVDFAGWSMPVHYGSIVAEHQATRTAAGLFDVSHMGRLKFTGTAAAAFLDGLVTRRIVDMAPGQVRYGLVTNDDGGVLDDVLVYRLADPSGRTYHLMVVNASNRGKILDWISPRLPNSADLELTDVTTTTAMIAVQGPLAIQFAQPHLKVDLAGMKYYTGVETVIAGQPAIVSRTGYTGEDGCELILPAGGAVAIWNSVLAAGESRGARAVGLGAPRHAAVGSGHAAVRPRAFRTRQSAGSRLGLRGQCRESPISRSRRVGTRQTIAADTCAGRPGIGGPARSRASTFRFCTARSRSAKSPAARFHPRSTSPWRWATCGQTWPRRGPNYRSISAVNSSRRASSRFLSTVAKTSRRPLRQRRV